VLAELRSVLAPQLGIGGGSQGHGAQRDMLAAEVSDRLVLALF
jgi:hypothetical protein